MPNTGKPFFRITRTLALVALAIALTLVIGISTGFASRGLSPLRNMVAGILASETAYPTVTPVPTEEGLVDLYALEGEVLAQWNTPDSVTNFRVTAYKIEELALPHPIQVFVNGEAETVVKAWRISITGTFEVLSLRYYIWIDETSVAAAQAPPGLVGFFFEPSVLREGAKLGMSYTESIEYREQLPFAVTLLKNPAP